MMLVLIQLLLNLSLSMKENFESLIRATCFQDLVFYSYNQYYYMWLLSIKFLLVISQHDKLVSLKGWSKNVFNHK